MHRSFTAMSQASTILPLHGPASCRAASGHASRWSALAIVVAVQFVFVVDAFIVNVALPSIRADLAASTGDMQGVLALYQILPSSSSPAAASATSTAARSSS
jgi:hypothetical protein